MAGEVYRKAGRRLLAQSGQGRDEFWRPRSVFLQDQPVRHGGQGARSAAPAASNMASADSARVCSSCMR